MSSLFFQESGVRVHREWRIGRNEAGGVSVYVSETSMVWAAARDIPSGRTERLAIIEQVWSKSSGGRRLAESLREATTHVVKDLDRTGMDVKARPTQATVTSAAEKTESEESLSPLSDLAGLLFLTCDRKPH